MTIDITKASVRDSHDIVDRLRRGMPDTADKGDASVPGYTAEKENLPENVKILVGYVSKSGSAIEAYKVSDRLNYWMSTYTLKALHLELAPYQTVIRMLVEQPDLVPLFTNKRFWVGGNGIDRNGTFPVDKEGNPSDNPAKKEPGRRVSVWGGPGPLLFGVRDNVYTWCHGARFTLSGIENASLPSADIVVGVV